MLPPANYYTFVALIDIIFTDGTKRICTGSIIHNNVVLSAAHCFLKMGIQKVIKADLTTSLVVIGNMKMYSSGYEQYLPIEKVLAHPKFKHSWAADIALVYTFAGMTGDKPGTVVSFVLNQNYHLTTNNVSIVSWGMGNSGKIKPHLRSKTSNEEYQEAITSDEMQPAAASIESSKEKQVNVNVKNHRMQKYNRRTKPRNTPYQTPTSITKGVSSSIYLRPIENVADMRVHFIMNNFKKSFVPLSESEESDHSRRKSHNSYNKNVRRAMKHEVNQLDYVEFTFKPIKFCTTATLYENPTKVAITNDTEALCFVSSNHYITDMDAGAPALVEGRLVGVIVGGVSSSGEHFSIGVKISCFCSWIINQLPNDGRRAACSENLCNIDLPI